MESHPGPRWTNNVREGSEQPCKAKRSGRRRKSCWASSRRTISRRIRLKRLRVMSIRRALIPMSSHQAHRFFMMSLRQLEPMSRIDSLAINCGETWLWSFRTPTVQERASIRSWSSSGRKERRPLTIPIKVTAFTEQTRTWSCSAFLHINQGFSSSEKWWSQPMTNGVRPAANEATTSWTAELLNQYKTRRRCRRR